MKGRQRVEDSKPCVTSMTIILFKRSFCKRSKHSYINNIEHDNEHAGNRPVTFVTHKGFAVFFFVLS